MQALKLIGYWCETSSWGNWDKDEWIHPNLLIDDEWAENYPERESLINYLTNGFPVISWRGLSYCRFYCGVEDRVIGYRELSDGIWIWPEGLSHYVAHHSVRLPEEFIVHAEMNDFVIPESIKTKVLQFIEKSEYGKVPVYIDFWERWCEERRVYQ